MRLKQIVFLPHRIIICMIRNFQIFVSLALLLLGMPLGMAQHSDVAKDALLLIDSEVSTSIQNDSETLAIFSGATTEDAFPPLSKLEIAPGLLTEDEKTEIASIIEEIERKSRVNIQLIIVRTNEIGLASAKVAALARRANIDREECTLVFDETGKQRTAYFSPLLRFKAGGPQRFLDALLAANENVLQGSGLRNAITTFLAEFEHGLLDLTLKPGSIFETDALADQPLQADELKKPSLTLVKTGSVAPDEAANLEEVETTTPSEKSEQAKAEDPAQMQNETTRSAPPAKPAIPTNDGSGVLLLIVILLLLIPVVWNLTHGPIRQLLINHKERKREAELQPLGQQPVQIKTLAVAAQENAQESSDAEAVLLRKPKIRSRETVAAQRAASVGSNRASDFEQPLTRAISYLRMLREAPDDMRENLMDLLEEQLLAMKKSTPVVVRPERKLEQSS